jgi:hypothetical protein
MGRLLGDAQLLADGLEDVAGGPQAQGLDATGGGDAPIRGERRKRHESTVLGQGEVARGDGAREVILR